jgi:hypothetical protein
VRDGVEEAEKGVAEGLSVEGGQEEVASTVDWVGGGGTGGGVAGGRGGRGRRGHAQLRFS